MDQGKGNVRAKNCHSIAKLAIVTELREKLAIASVARNAAFCTKMQFLAHPWASVGQCTEIDRSAMPICLTVAAGLVFLGIQSISFSGFRERRTVNAATGKTISQR